jgi:hypothetical protein
MKISNNSKDQIILMSSEQFQELIQEINEVKDLLLKKSKKNDLPELLRSSEVHKLLKIGPSSLAGLRQNGTIPFTKIGGSIYHFKEDIKKIIYNNYSGFHEY